MMPPVFLMKLPYTGFVPSASLPLLHAAAAAHPRTIVHFIRNALGNTPPPKDAAAANVLSFHLGARTYTPFTSARLTGYAGPRGVARHFFIGPIFFSTTRFQRISFQVTINFIPSDISTMVYKNNIFFTKLKIVMSYTFFSSELVQIFRGWRLYMQPLPPTSTSIVYQGAKRGEAIFR
jgi:hypothetical protein